MFAKDMFDYARDVREYPDFLAHIKGFAAQEDFRSAGVSELLLPDISQRRPLRPEDLDFLKFEKPVDPGARSRLAALASGRILYCLNDDARDGRAANAGFDAKAIRAVLESLAFEYLNVGAGVYGPEVINAHDVAQFFENRARDYGDVLATLSRDDYLIEGLGVAAIQNYFPRHRIIASGAFRADASWLLPPVEEQFARGDAVGTAMRQLLELTNLDSRTFYWQFYLPTTLARANLPWSMALGATHDYAYLGVALTLELDFRAFLYFAERALVQMSGAAAPLLINPAQQRAGILDALVPAFAALDPVALRELQTGFAIGRELSDAAMWDLATQLAWLGRIDVHVEAAGSIANRIDREWPDIDRDTFVEPQEMCSTTHVHDDHRLVMIEAGDMIFWGAPNMRHRMYKGDKILIPAGRLHGSTVVSPECTYHQPIIPERWIADTFAEIRRRRPMSREIA